MGKKIVFNDLHGRLQVQGMMGSLQIVPKQVFHESKIESRRVEKFGGMKIHILLLDGAVETFGMGIHLRGLGVGMPVRGMESSNLGIESFHELTSIVGEDKGQGEGKENRHEVKELFGCSTRMARRCEGKGPAGIEVGKGNDIATGTMDDRLNGIERSTVARVHCLEMLGFSRFWSSFPLNDLPIVANLCREHSKAPKVADEIANGGGGWAREMTRIAEGEERMVNLLLSEVRMIGSLAFHLYKNGLGPDTGSEGLWTGGFLV